MTNRITVASQAHEEDPARIDRLRPEFFEHASVEAIDAHILRSRRQQARWERRVQTLTELRQTRIRQKERSEWPGAPEAGRG
ncbi:hypothetical protein [Streptomyces sp. NPDC056105]|uniref:hypothetical protein n=1 Tax=Streptomyces sp. NPDC056105 TaxID=3345714 RepID=UPI0035DBA131